MYCMQSTYELKCVLLWFISIANHWSHNYVRKLRPENYCIFTVQCGFDMKLKGRHWQQTVYTYVWTFIYTTLWGGWFRAICNGLNRQCALSLFPLCTNIQWYPQWTAPTPNITDIIALIGLCFIITNTTTFNHNTASFIATNINTFSHQYNITIFNHYKHSHSSYIWSQSI